MGNELFGTDIAGIIADVMGDALPGVTITRLVKGDRDPDNLTGGRVDQPPVTFDCTGFWEDFSGTPPPGVTVETNDRIAVLIGDTVPNGGLPQVDDAITVHEDIGDSTLYMVQLINRDPAAAVYRYQCRDRRGPDGE